MVNRNVPIVPTSTGELVSSRQPVGLQLTILA
jgi:hypothetical protein